MMAFNLKKHAQTYPKSYEAYLRDNNKSHGLSAHPDPGNTDWLLQQPGHHKNDPGNVPFNEMLGAERKGTNDGVVEKALDQNPKMYNEKRLEKSWDVDVDHVANLMEAAEDQKYLNAMKEARKGDNHDTEFWDKEVGVQIIGDNKTTIVNNVQKSQLQNQPDRFSGLDKTMPINENYQDDLQSLTKDDKYYDMVMASVKDADTMLLHLYATAAYEDRELTAEEEQMVVDINSGKVNRLAELDKA